jgi:hypothetical protein
MQRVVKLLLILFLLAITGCVNKPTYLEFYPPTTPEEMMKGYGAIKVLDYRKPAGMITVFGISLL